VLVHIDVVWNRRFGFLGVRGRESGSVRGGGEIKEAALGNCSL